MPAAYDTYDYPSYWEGRDYEHLSETIALKYFLNNIPDLRTILEVGAGYGRLTPIYALRGKKIILLDPSAKLLKLAKKKNKDYKNIKFIQSKIENLNKKLRKKSVDLIIMVRVLHHIKDCDKAFKLINNTLDEKGHFILEFPNKSHFKATITEFLKGNLTFPLEIFPKDIRSKIAKKKKTLPFINYHPGDIEKKLFENGFEIIKKRSVSNIRSPFLKKYLPLETLIGIEKNLQKPLAGVNFGPSIFILARKKGHVK
jgi:ubiquinone/menaquinone biosynthesis C-methylase UbiE